ncbi:MAG TPA: CDP-glycerol glycerophosphotransferase family protein, partial [Methanobacterium sp.]|nr:CDP-glycerol glycerophosphotransferase family protein [Methanobacterium sp.]
SSHKDIIEPWYYRNFRKYFNRFILEKKYIFLQHGVIKDDISDILGKKNPNNYFDLFICGAKPEFDYINSNYGYLPGEVVYTGLARFDYLHDTVSKNQILVMPTWREGIVKTPWDKTITDEKFLNSKYYNAFQSIINNEKLIDLLEKNDFNLVFYPHYEVQKYLKYFKSKSDRIVIANSDSYDVQTLLKESKLLITDFSSVFFDFAYMDKPLAYYQFDKDYFFKNHYKKGYFSYEKDGFGPVLETEEEILSFVEKNFKNSFSLQEKYRRRADEFFELKDKKNCERIYNEIINLNNQYKVLDGLTEEIFEKYDQKFDFQELEVYLYRNFLMYVSYGNVNKIYLRLKNEIKEVNLDFYFEDLCTTKDKRSKYKNKNIAIVKLPAVKIKSIKTGKANIKTNTKDLSFKIDLDLSSKINII